VKGVWAKGETEFHFQLQGTGDDFVMREEGGNELMGKKRNVGRAHRT